MCIICGADGCRGGWVVISKDLDSGSILGVYALHCTNLHIVNQYHRSLR
jgi:predicted RNase H-like nuclease